MISAIARFGGAVWPSLREGLRAAPSQDKFGSTLARRCAACGGKEGGAICNLYHADLWIMPTNASERALAAVIAAMESA
jgi:hypothetical protein